ncbi:BioY protein [Pseudothermotoga hypogea DSM 11164 = NBRC 106472]|uniref:Biotin transporter n=1 Tax=Pseudothermotoga hypogea DSM 11164 = NBRC 106472 TaxID=1123384 RepID=A0A0X1KSE3_9THEM|nr:biotin transporter BioY [Pseudothermotoga hypogea]AJC74217.1 BioY protein [Pseudothermotoga hypogea DSM 11164 = NBRC 106472]
MLERVLERRSLVTNLLVALGFSVLTGVAAQIRIPLFFTPVPITGQTFVVLLTPFLIGSWSVLSQTMYVALGVAGLPWFSGWKAGLSVLLGPTGGYLVGFIVASLFLSKHRTRSYLGTVVSMLFANFLMIHGLGLTQMALWFYAKGSNPDLWKLLSMSLLPFVPGDLVKIFLASSIAVKTLQKE